jgi:A/G-specific adenine glycosylase
MAANRFSELLLEWFRQNKRALPWRNTKDPYKIWLSEVMLQQTRVSQGLPYYERFVRQYPTVKKLAAAPEKELLRLWQGLGYYSRARNLHRCAKIISDGGGKFPETPEELKKLPGIGDYTAAAIASFAFNKPAAVVDGNVFRVLSRIFAIDLDIASPAGKKYFFELANTLIDPQNPGEFNQALMEFGAMHCTPRNPKCDDCVFSRRCKAFQAENVSFYPVKTKVKARKVRHFNYFVFRKGKQIWMQQRMGNDVWKGLHEFYLVETNRAVSEKKVVTLFPTKVLNGVNVSAAKKIRQILSHQEIEGKFFEIPFADVSPAILKGTKGKFYSLKEIEKLAKPVLINHFLQLKTQV